MAKDDDEIPPLSELERQVEQEKRDARDLLAGFDRPGRGPKSGGRRNDFVAHYSGKQLDKQPPKKTDRSRERATFVLPKKKERFAAILPWLGAATLMLLLGFLVAFVLTRSPEPNRTATIPSSATTITSVVRPRADIIPPPDPAVPAPQTTEQTIIVPSPTITPSSSSSTSSSKAHGRQDDTYLRDF